MQRSNKNNSQDGDEPSELASLAPLNYSEAIAELVWKETGYTPTTP